MGGTSTLGVALLGSLGDLLFVVGGSLGSTGAKDADAKADPTADAEVVAAAKSGTGTLSSDGGVVTGTYEYGIVDDVGLEVAEVVGLDENGFSGTLVGVVMELSDLY
jgi:hypothetical protein